LLFNEIREQVKNLLDISKMTSTDFIELRLNLLNIVLEFLYFLINDLAIFTAVLDEEISVGTPIDLLHTRSNLILKML
jgi:hypothetical protein